jgi:hypothetical protein
LCRTGWRRREREGGKWIRRRLCCRWGEKKKGTRKGKAEKEKWNSSKDLCAIQKNCRDLSVKENFPSIWNPNEETPKMKVGEFLKLYNISLGLKFKNSKFIFLHMRFLNKSWIWITFVLKSGIL